MSKRICEHCGKGYMKGNVVSHSKQRAKRSFQPNLHKTTLILKGVKTRMLLCTRCIRMLKKKTEVPRAVGA